MKKSDHEQQMLKEEFLSFMSQDQQSQGEQPPQHLTKKVFEQAYRWHRNLKYYISSKFIAVHLIAGFISLIICPQFGVNPFGASEHLAHFFMNFGGQVACGLFCGIIFYGPGSVLKWLFISPAESHMVFYQLQKQSFLHSFVIKNSMAIIGVFLIIFMILGDLKETSLLFLSGWIFAAITFDFISSRYIQPSTASQIQRIS